MEGVAQDDSDSFMEGKKNCDYKQKHREDRSISRLNQYKPVLTQGRGWETGSGRGWGTGSGQGQETGSGRGQETGSGRG